jgi:4-hydroxymandelate oxidase
MPGPHQHTMAVMEIEDIAHIVAVDEFEAAARAKLTTMAYEYLASGAADEVTLRENRLAFDRIRLLPRHLVDVSKIDTSCTLFGRDHPFPILLAPTGYHKLFHAEGELETIRGANSSEATLVASIFSTVAFEEMSAAADLPLWFQLYFNPDRSVTKDLVQTVVAAGCAALCLTVDSPVNQVRDRETRAGFMLPDGMERANLAKLGSIISGASHRPVGRNIYTPVRSAAATWEDLDWLRAQVSIPLLVKGIVHPDDAATALQAGCNGIIVSNHGARVLDSVPASLDLLAPIVDRVEGRAPVLMDGGIRRGTDIYKALAKGAAAVLIGRPYLFGLAAAGAAGVARVVEILRTELEMTMGLMGRTTLTSIDRDSLWKFEPKML